MVLWFSGQNFNYKFVIIKKEKIDRLFDDDKLVIEIPPLEPEYHKYFL